MAPACDFALNLIFFLMAKAWVEKYIYYYNDHNLHTRSRSLTNKKVINKNNNNNHRIHNILQ